MVEMEGVVSDVLPSSMFRATSRRINSANLTGVVVSATSPWPNSAFLVTDAFVAFAIASASRNRLQRYDSSTGGRSNRSKSSLT